MSKPVLEVQNVSKFFGTRIAVNDVSLTVHAGEIMGLIGPNGTGKTTLIRMIAGLASMNGGEIKINGFNIASQFEKAIAKVGGIIEEPRMYNHLSGYDNLKFFASLYGKIDRQRIDELVKIAKLQNRIKDKVRAYSLGMRQRLGIISSLIHRPNLLILDEPLNGLDPTGIVEMREFLRHIAKSEGVAILVSSHNLLEVELLCDNVTIIKNGTIVTSGSISQLQRDVLESQRFSIRVSHPNYAARIIKENFEVSGIGVVANSVVVKASEQIMQRIINELVKYHISIFGIKTTSKTLEEIYLEKIKSKYGGDDAIS